jgi:macrodomain Ter protein organizer (MatP/YcbG family)
MVAQAAEAQLVVMEKGRRRRRRRTTTATTTSTTKKSIGLPWAATPSMGPRSSSTCSMQPSG